MTFPIRPLAALVLSLGSAATLSAAALDPDTSFNYSGRANAYFDFGGGKADAL